MAYNNNVAAAILQTLIYSDIFAFPLTQEELWHFLLSKKKISRKIFEQTLALLSSSHGEVVSQNGMYCLRGREKIIAKRRITSEESKKKLSLARSVAANLAYIPTISFIGISGGVAMGNATKDDDIDFFIITKKKSLFMTRLLVLALLELLNVRRARTDIDVANKICVNLLMDETHLTWPQEKQDIYIAHEIVQIVPVFERKGMYQQFLTANSWVQQFFPNVFEQKRLPLGNKWQRNYYSLSFLSMLFRLLQFEKLVNTWQKRVMKKHQTNETISDTLLAFHPFDYRSKTLEDMRLKMRQLGLLTNI